MREGYTRQNMEGQVMEEGSFLNTGLNTSKDSRRKSGDHVCEPRLIWRKTGNKRLKGSSVATRHTNLYALTSKNISYLGSVQFSRSVVSNSCDPMDRSTPGLRPPPTPGVYSNPCPSSRWCHPAISSSVVPFSSCLQSFPASGSFQISQLFTWGGQSNWSFSFSISPSNEHPGLMISSMDWLDLLAFQGTLKSLLQPQFKSINSLALSFLYRQTLTSMTTGKTIVLTSYLGTSWLITLPIWSIIIKEFNFHIKANFFSFQRVTT